MSREVVIVSAVRTAVGSFQGALADISAPQLGSTVIQEALKRANLVDSQVDEVIMGNVLQAGLGQNPARQAWLKAGYSQFVPAMTINKVCGSGLKAVMLAAQSVSLGDADIVVAGGMENMTQAPYLLPGARSGLRLGDSTMVDSMIRDGLWCAMCDIHMGITAENIAEHHRVTRAEQDEFAAWSQLKAEQAIASGRFKDEIVPVAIPQRKGEPVHSRRMSFLGQVRRLRSLVSFVRHSRKKARLRRATLPALMTERLRWLLCLRIRLRSLGLRP